MSGAVWDLTEYRAEQAKRFKAVLASCRPLAKQDVDWLYEVTQHTPYLVSVERMCDELIDAHTLAQVTARITA